MDDVTPRPIEPPWTTCDWGFCDNDATTWRWTDTYGCWLPVCDDCTTRETPRNRTHGVPGSCSCGHVWSQDSVTPAATPPQTVTVQGQIIAESGIDA